MVAQKFKKKILLDINFKLERSNSKKNYTFTKTLDQKISNLFDIYGG